jgi:hypothetical protein
MSTRRAPTLSRWTRLRYPSSVSTFFGRGWLVADPICLEGYFINILFDMHPGLEVNLLALAAQLRCLLELCVRCASSSTYVRSWRTGSTNRARCLASNESAEQCAQVDWHVATRSPGLVVRHQPTSSVRRASFAGPIHQSRACALRVPRTTIGNAAVPVPVLGHTG